MGNPFNGRPLRKSARVCSITSRVGELVPADDPQGGATVFVARRRAAGLQSAGSDLNSSGLLLLTDSGDLANRPGCRPRYGLEREYVARIRGELHPAEKKTVRASTWTIPARFASVRRDGPAKGPTAGTGWC